MLSKQEDLLEKYYRNYRNSNLLAKRLEKRLPHLIHTDHDNIRRSLHILQHISQNKLNGEP